MVALIANDGSYDLTMLDQQGIDRYVLLETNPNSALSQVKNSNITRMPSETTALLIAAEIFSSYVNLRDYGGPRLR